MSAVVGYSPPRFAGAITLDLSKNEGRAPADPVLARYPDLAELRAAMAREFGVPAETLLVTAGADDALLRLCLLALRTEPGSGRKQAVVAAPTFEMIPRYVELAGGEQVTVAWRDGALPVDEMIAAAARPALVFVVSPNNPTGAVVSGEDLTRIATALPDALIVWDGAYAEFADEDLMADARSLANVVIVRTLSKAWGLAGLRVGCAIATPDLVQRLHAAANPMPVSIASARLAIARLRDGADEVRDYVAWTTDCRRLLVQRLRELGVATAAPSQANFVLARCVGSQWLTAALAALGIAVRRFPDQPDLADAVRIGVPQDAAQWQTLNAALTAVLAPAALLFDMDGVLADVSMSYRVAIEQTAASFGVSVTAADIRAAKRRGNANDDWQLTRSLMAMRGVVQPIEVVTERFEGFYRELQDRERLMIGVERLRAWRERLPFAVVTGRPRAQAEAFLERFAIRDLFDVVVAREDAPLKPDPAPVQLALQRLGVRSAWMLGDTVDDLVAARRAGVLPIGVGAELAGKEAARVLAQPEELEELL